MHAIAFGAKRVFHSFLRVTRKPLLLWPKLTGARFDMLSAFLEGFQKRPKRIDVRQSELRRKLGVCASVVSRMVRALEELKWVERRREPRDRRTWRLSLTPLGEQVIREARRILLRVTERLVRDAICRCNPRHRDYRFVRLFEFTQYLGHVRFDFGDPATLTYPWWPKVIDP